MAQTISEYTGRLIVKRCWCGIQHAVPESLNTEQLRRQDDGDDFELHCPLGHKYIPAGTSLLAQEKAAHARTASCLNSTSERLKTSRNVCRGLKGANTRIKNRISNGVCPCCNRSFKNLHRHMTSQHPDFAPESPKAGG